MKRFLSTSFIALVLVISAAGAAPAVHAQEGDMGGTNSVTGTNAATPGTTAAGCLEDPGDPGVFYDADTGEICTGVARSALSTGDPAAAKTETPLPPPTDVSNGFGSIMTWIMTLFAWLVGVAAITLDNAVFYTVVTMGDYVNHLSAIGVTWRILRDIGNIMLIFGFLAVGITTILNVDWYGGGKKMLPMMFVAAVFLNFSLFISEAIIDTGNLFATQFYTQINGGNPAGAKNFDTLAIRSDGISNKIMGQLGLQNIYNAGRVTTDVFKAGNTWIIGFMAVILFIVTAFVMFSLAFVLIFRFVMLVFLIILSPIGFASLAVPGFAARTKQYWETLFHNAITAPILLLGLYIALAVITDARFLTGLCASTDPTNPTCTPNWVGYVSGNLTGFGSMVLSFIVAMVLLIAVVVYAKRWSAFGADFAIKAGAALSFGASAYGMSALTGGSAFLARKGLQRAAPNSAAIRAISNYALRPLERAKFDIRSVGGGAALGALNVGEASAPIGASTVGRGKQGVEWVQHTGEKANQDYDRETRIPRLRQAVAENDDVTMSRLVGRMSDTELESHAVADLFAHNPAAAANLPQARFDRLMQSDKLSDQLKETIRVSRNTGTDARYAAVPHPDPRFVGRTFADVNLNGAPAGPGGVPARIPALSSAQRAELPSNVLTFPHVMAQLTTSDFAAIARRAALEGPNQRAMGAYITGLALADPRSAQIHALAATNRTFAAYFGIP
ncbi:MAG: hypothetical protein Q7R59_02120 [bacterium]|nr:hypothetical protein [bacterium]